MSHAAILRAANPDDALAMEQVRVASQPEGTESNAETLARLWGYLRQAEEQAAYAVVAHRGGEMVAWAISRLMRFEQPPQPDQVPDGWYLMGVVVLPEHRRGGLGLALTQARLAWLAARTDRAYCFTTEDNTASIYLHQALGFEPVPGRHHVPGLSFRADRVFLVKQLQPSMAVGAGG